MHSSLAMLLPLLAALTSSVAASQGATCNATSLCSSDYPCCSEYGFCGDGYYCLGGCNPLYSNTLNSCKPNPMCESANYTLVDTSRILTNYTYFDGNVSEYDWVVEQGTIMNTTSSGQAALALLLTENGGGTLLSSTRYVHYGRITTKLKTGRWAGVVTAFITMSSVKDEIDWEFPGNQTTEGQTNYFWQGNIPSKTVGITETGLSDTYATFHDYTVDWQPDSLTFLVDGNVTRTILAADCLDNATGVSHFPNTPSRIQLSIWPAGISSEPKGTIAWAGGMINWNDPDYVSAGHFYALFESVSVECKDPTAAGAGDDAYIYGPNITLDTPSISFTNQSSLLNAAGALSIPFTGMQGLVAVTVMSLAFAAHLF